MRSIGINNMASPSDKERQLEIETPTTAETVERGGFEVEFVERPPESLLQSECPVCLLVLREPYQVTCCGYSYCQVCIEQVQAEKNPCPMCNHTGFTVFPNKGLKRALYSVSVRCAYRGEGCRWEGELLSLEEHLNENPEAGGEHLLDGCEFVQINCIHCLKPFRRRLITAHQLKECPQRPFRCDYCYTYESHYEDVITEHKLTCSFYPVACPNECGMHPQRQNMERHVTEDCPFTVLDCDFQYAGCKAHLTRKEMRAHLAENLLAHVSLMTTHSKTKIAERDQEIAQLREELRKHQQETEELQKENQLLKNTLSENSDDIAQLKSALSQEMAAFNQKMAPQFPMEFTMTDFNQRVSQHEVWHSEPFYTHPQGYKMCLKVRTARESRDSCFSIGACLMRGEFDDFLRWPFQGAVTIKMMNQLQDSNHFRTTLFFIGPSTVVGRVTSGERAERGRGEDLSYNKLEYQLAKHCMYLKDNCLRFQVTRVTNTKWALLEKQCLAVESSVLVPPVEFTMTDYNQHKKDDATWISPSFYSHSHGYRMCLSVDANGYYLPVGPGSSKHHTHVSVFVHLMRGDFDGQLKWPFRGTVTIQLLNQLDGKDHHEESIRFGDRTPDDNAGRVMTGERDKGWGHQFIAHRELTYNQAKNTQYLMHDSLAFRVSKIVIKK